MRIIKNKKTTTIIATASLALSAGFIIGIGGWFGGGASIPADTFTRGLVGYWSFDEGGGDRAFDGSGNSNNGTTTGAQWTSGKMGGALQFDGVDDYVDAGNDSSLSLANDLSVELWFKTSSVTSVSYASLLSKYEGGVNNNYQIWILTNDKKIRFEVYDGTNNPVADSGVAVDDGIWHHVVGVRDTGEDKIKIYLDGALKNSVADTITAPITNSHVVQIGLYGAREFNGLIDEVRIYNRALSAEEVRFHYNRGGPVGHWTFDEGNGQTAWDSSGSNDGTLGTGSSTDASDPAWTTGKYGTGLLFDGENDYVDCGDDTILNPTKEITVEGWVNPDSVANYGVVVRPVGGIYWIQWQGTNNFLYGRISLDDATDLRVNFPSGTPALNQWTHIAITYKNGNRLRAYVNGVEVAQSEIGTADIDSPMGNTMIGGGAGGGSGYFDGLIDDVRIYNYARTPDEIRLDYNQGYAIRFGGSPADYMTRGLVGLWSMDEGSGDAAYDSSGEEHHGVITTISCPEGWIPVPGDSTYGTSDFCVMKYEAKCTGSAEGTGCDDASDIPVSQAANKPWRYTISQTEAISACQRAGGHLITNNEWMTIARNIEQMEENWCELDGSGGGNTPGTKYLAAGHNDAAWESPYNYCLAAYSNDTLPCYGTKGTGSDYNPTDTSSCGAVSGTQKRTHTLSNGEVIWDLAGNVWEWTDDTLDCSEHPIAGAPASNWYEFTEITDYRGLDDGGDASDTKYTEPSDNTWNSNQRVGRIYTDAGDTGNRAFLRGGDWDDGAYAGAFTLGLYRAPGDTGYSIGFRCAR